MAPADPRPVEARRAVRRLPTDRRFPVVLWMAAMLSACGVAPDLGRQPAGGALAGEVPAGGAPANQTPANQTPANQAGVSAVPDAVPRAEPRSVLGNPRSYVVNGKQYFTLASARGFVQRGVASWYGPKFHGRRTSSGETYDMYKMTAAHKTLPLPTYVSVRNLSTGDEIVVRVNDRGPFHGDRILDLSYVAALKLGFARKGTELVEIRVLDAGTAPAPAGEAGQDRPARSDDPIRLFVQAGAFQAAANATRLQARLTAQSRWPVRVRQAMSNGQVMYRVWLGPVPSVEDAIQTTIALGESGVENPRIVVE